MKTKVLFVAMFAFAALYVMRCTGAVAPKQEGTTKAVENTDTATGSKVKTSTSTASATDTSSDTDTSSGTNTDTTAAALGEVTTTTNELGFTPVAVIGQYTTTPAKGLSILISDYAYTEDSLKKVASYKCTACSGTADPNCKDLSTIKQLMVSFGVTGTKVTAEAFPKVDDITMTGMTDGTGVSAFFGTNFDNAGTITFQATGRPASATDDFDFDIDLTLKDGKKFAGTIKGKIITFPDNPDVPNCSDDEYPKATYE